jgi:hypothetical protein
MFLVCFASTQFLFCLGMERVDFLGLVVTLALNILLLCFIDCRDYHMGDRNLLQTGNGNQIAGGAYSAAHVGSFSHGLKMFQP